MNRDQNSDLCQVRLYRRQLWELQRSCIWSHRGQREARDKMLGGGGSGMALQTTEISLWKMERCFYMTCSLSIPPDFFAGRLDKCRLFNEHLFPFVSGEFSGCSSKVVLPAHFSGALPHHFSYCKKVWSLWKFVHRDFPFSWNCTT